MYKCLLLVFLAVFLVSSCDLFDPRIPEDPSNSGVAWIDPTSPDIVVDNIEATLNGSSMQYMDCFSESFVFYADTSDINEYFTYIFNDWLKIVENDVLTQLFSIVPDTVSVTAVFLANEDHPDPTAPTDSATIYRDYTIVFPSAIHTQAAGIAEIHMIESSEGYWTINEWYDARPEEASSFVTWAVMKAFYR